MVQRYTLVAPGVLNTDMNTGSWVRYSDYQKLEEELEQIRQQVKAPGDDGWIEWQGDIDPLDEPVRGIVEVKFKDGSTDIGGAAKWYWAHDGDNADIIAYRVVKP